MKKVMGVFLVVFVLAVAGQAALALNTTYYWVGATNADWDTLGSWNTQTDGLGSNPASITDTTDVFKVGTWGAGSPMQDNVNFNPQLQILTGGELQMDDRVVDGLVVKLIGGKIIGGGYSKADMGGALEVVNSSTLDNSDARSDQYYAISATITGSGDLEKTGTGNYVAISADNSGWTGNFDLREGQLNLYHANALGTNAAGGTVTLHSGTHLYIDANIPRNMTMQDSAEMSNHTGDTYSGTLTLEGRAEITGNRLYMTGKITGNGSIIVYNGSSYRLEIRGNANDYRHTIIPTGQELILGEAAYTDARLGGKTDSTLVVDGTLAPYYNSVGWNLDNHIYGKGSITIDTTGPYRRTLTIAGKNVKPGDSIDLSTNPAGGGTHMAGVGILSLNTDVAFAKTGDTFAGLYIDILGGNGAGNAVAGTDYDELKMVDNASATLSGLSNCNLYVSVADSLKAGGLEGDVLTILWTRTNVSAMQFANAPAGTLDLGGNWYADISYNWNGTNGTITLSNFDYDEPPVPEPASLSLVGLALLALKRRRS